MEKKQGIIMILIITLVLTLGYITYGEHHFAVPISSEEVKELKLVFLDNFEEESLSEILEKNVVAIGFIKEDGVISDSKGNKLKLTDIEIKAQKNSIALLIGTPTLPNKFAVQKKIAITGIPDKKNIRKIINNGIKNTCSLCNGKKELLNCVTSYEIKSHLEIDWKDTADESTLRLEYITYIDLSDKQDIVLIQNLLSENGEFRLDSTETDKEVCLKTTGSKSVKVYPTNNPEDEKVKIVFIDHDEGDTKYLNIEHKE